MNEIIRIVKYQIIQFIRNPRFYMIVLLNSIFSGMFLLPVRQLLKTYDVMATPWAFIFLFSHASVIFCFMAGIVILFSDAPFFDKTQMFLLVRTGKRKWLMGQIIYMLAAGVMYYILLYILSLLFMAPFLTWKNEWGSIWNSLARSEIGLKFNIYLTVPAQVLNAFTPMQALGWTFGMGMLNALLLGMIMLCCNLFFKKEIGICIALVLILLPYRLDFMPTGLHYIATAAWMNLIYLIPDSVYQGPGLWQQLGIITGMIIGLVILCFMGITKKDLPEVAK